MERNNIVVETLGWVSLNMLALSLVGVSIYFGNDQDMLHSIVYNAYIDQAMSICATVSFLGGGILIAGCQWVFLRHLFPQIPGGGWGWVLSSLASSTIAFLPEAISVLGLGDYPKATDFLFFTFLIISMQVSSLSIIHGILLYASKYKGVVNWVITNILAFSFAIIFSYFLIYRWSDNIRPPIAFLTLLVICVESVSGWRLIRVLDSREESMDA